MLRLAIRNILYRPLDSALSFVLFALGIGMTVVLLLASKQFNQQLERNAMDIDLVLGAKGSPLQLVLSSIYHIDVPTGNIPESDARAFLNPAHPLMKLAVPLAQGDSYRGYRIVGTDERFDTLYQLTLREGRPVQGDFEILLGAEVAAGTGLGIGDSLRSSHGLQEGADDLGHADAPPFRVVGIYGQSGTVADRLLTCSVESIRKLHHHGHAHEEEEAGAEITSVLLRFRHKTNIQSLNLARNINENTNLMAAAPAYELSKLYNMLGVGTEAIRYLAILLILASAVSIFLTMLRNLRERRYEMALLRVLGGRAGQVFLLVIWEGVLIAFSGALAGLLLGHLGMYVLGSALQTDFGYAFNAGVFYSGELLILAGGILVGIVSALAPAIAASRKEIHGNLSR